MDRVTKLLLEQLITAKNDNLVFHQQIFFLNYLQTRGWVCPNSPKGLFKFQIWPTDSPPPLLI